MVGVKTNANYKYVCLWFNIQKLINTTTAIVIASMKLTDD